MEAVCRAGRVTASWEARNFLIQATLLRDRVPDFGVYPFSIPAIRALEEIHFEQPVTFFVGENGSGKSTLMEAIAVAWGLNAEGGSRNFSFSTRASHSGLNDCLRLSRSPRRARDAYFLRAESYFNVATEIEALDSVPGSGPKIIGSYGGKSLHEQSHGESFFALFMNRFNGGGFYVLDEPEAALSPARQLSLLTRLHDLVGEGAQFVIATHSPILMAYPHAQIFLLEDGPLRQVAYDETDHYKLTRNFLNRPRQWLDDLLAPPEDSGGA